ncbi:MAG: response regulator transcription factor [Chloroflexi bacterium]|nr:response regulator transcription factor [Chloroflexota bacterium]
MAQILAVDDDNEVLDTLGRVLRHENHDVSLASSAAQALDVLQRTIPDLMILDVIMPEMDGVTLCRRLRRDARFMALPILFLTARGSTEDIVTGLEAGADDYIVKPFELPELRARISAVLRRGKRDSRGEMVLELDGLRLDSDTYRAYVNDDTIQLTSTEHRLLRYLMEHPNQALSPSHLLQAVWEYPPNTGDPDLVRAHVRNLRAKLERSAQRRYIRTIHGVGYMIST